MTHATSRPSHLLLIGDFAPLQLAHLHDINRAIGMADTVHIIITPPADRSLPSGRSANISDVARWVQVSCQSFAWVKVHTTASLGMDIAFDYQTGDTLSDDKLTKLCQLLTIDKQSTHIYQLGDTDASAKFTPSDRLAVRDQPLQYFDKLAPACRYFYTQTVCIVGGESSGKTTLIHKLANHYGANIALEMGRLYTHSHLGGTELGLQYSDYLPIAINHAHAIDTAKASARAAITLVDTDFVTTQAFCEVYEKRTHPVVASLADTYRMDLTIYLDNNVAWVADGMRRLGDGQARSHFAQKLLDLLAHHHIAHHTIDDADYHERYRQAVAIIDKFILSK